MIPLKRIGDSIIELCEQVAADVFGDEAVKSGVVDIQIHHERGEYIQLRQYNVNTNSFVDVDFKALMKSNEAKYTLFIKGGMGSGKTHLAIRKIAGPIIENGGNVLAVTPNISLSNATIVEFHSAGVQMTSYKDKKRKSENLGRDVNKKHKTGIEKCFLSGIVAIDVPTGIRDDTILTTTFDSVHIVDHDVRHSMLLVDETSKVLQQYTSAEYLNTNQGKDILRKVLKYHSSFKFMRCMYFG